jgi:hypothetical protein
MSLQPSPESPVSSALLLELMTWVVARPRTYGETMDAWRTSCPRMPVWEDAVGAGLVEVLAGGGAGLSGATVRLTSSGHAWLASRREAREGLEAEKGRE